MHAPRGQWDALCWLACTPAAAGIDVLLMPMHQETSPLAVLGDARPSRGCMQALLHMHRSHLHASPLSMPCAPACVRGCMQALLQAQKQPASVWRSPAPHTPYLHPFASFTSAHAANSPACMSFASHMCAGSLAWGAGLWSP